MTLRVVVDACVLHQFWPRDVLLRLAEEGLHEVVWSAAILDEMERSLAEREIRTPRPMMEDAFPEALSRRWRRHLRAVPGTVAESDRHVVALAIAERAEVIVTVNVRDFAPRQLARMGIQIQTPDDFLADALTRDPETVIGVLADQVRDCKSPPVATVASLLDRADHPRFTRAVAALTDALPG